MDIKSIIQQAIEYTDRAGEIPSRYKLAQELQVSEITARMIRFLLEHRDVLTLPENKTERRISKSSEGPNYNIVSTSSDIRTLDQLLKFCNVDMAKWKVKRHIVNSWGSFNNENFQVKAWLEEISKGVYGLSLEEMADTYGDLLKKYKPNLEEINKINYKTGKLMFQFDPVDQHHGGLSWWKETGQNWDIKISKNVLSRAADHFAQIAKDNKVSKILYTAGGDFLNVDNEAGTTTKGTPQHEDVRWQKSFLTGLELIISSIDRLAMVAPVHVITVGGNHDSNRMFYIGVTLQHHYAGCESVTIDNRPLSRKYYNFYSNLIGISHGQDEKISDIPGLMAAEVKELWAKCNHYYFRHGHIHKEKGAFIPLVDQQKVHIEWSPSLTALTAWAKSKGYMSVRKSKAYLYHADHGNIADFRYFHKED